MSRKDECGTPCVSTVGLWFGPRIGIPFTFWRTSDSRGVENINLIVLVKFYKISGKTPFYIDVILSGENSHM